MRSLNLAFILGVLGSSQLVFGQQVVVPIGAILAKPSALQWQLTVCERPTASTAQTPGTPPTVLEVRSIEVQANLRHEEDKAANGTQFTIWCWGSMEFYKTPPHNKFFNCSTADEQFYIVKPGLHFGELAWVSKDKFLGKKNIDGKPFLVFGQGRNPLPPDASDPILVDETTSNGQYKLQDIEWLAYVDATTRLPVYAQDRKAIYLYQMGSAPPGKLTLPAEILALLKFRDEQTRKLSVQPSKS